MFYEVRIFDDKGNLKKIVGSKASSKRFWDSYYKNLEKENRKFQSQGQAKRGESTGASKRGKGAWRQRLEP